MYPIVRRESFSDTTFLWEVHAPDIAQSAQPGHFVMLRLCEGGERIPLTVADYDRERGTITMVVQTLGKTTHEMRDDFKQGDKFLDFVGPLGLPQHIDKVGHVVLVGGGLGVAPVFPQLRAFKEVGNRTTAIMGFRTKDLVFWEDRFRDFADDLIICTDDGSYGKQGLVTAALQEVAERDNPDLVIAIGPLPMMHACVEATRPFGVKTMVSLNTIMVDGTGMCGSCRVTVGSEVKFACVDGPDFDGHKVDFKELYARQRRFKRQEALANEDFDRVCGIEKQLIIDGKRNYKKYAALEPEQVSMPERDPRERINNFKEVNLGYSIADALRESERCIQCAKPTCVAGCPVGIDIPSFIRKLLVRDVDGALETIYESSMFPSICGRVCPQESQCEAQCILVRSKKPKLESVAIGRLERFIGDHAKPPKATPPVIEHPLGKVAIVGSGPAGLAAAADLVRLGATVTVYEALHVLGGVLQYGIPTFRLPRDIINREVQRLKDMGVHFEINKVIGRTFTLPDLTGKMGYDAVFVAAGAGAPSFLGIPGEYAGQVYSANEFLTRVNLMGGDRFPHLGTPISFGTSVVVIGAGNTAMDCLRVAKRLGVATVRCVYRRSEAEAPARIEELRHAKEERIEFFFLHAPVEILLDGGDDVRGMKVQKMTLGEPDERGRRKPVPLDEFLELECDTVIYALGTKPNPIIGQATPGLDLNRLGNIVADDDTQCTNLPGIFAGGDIVTGGATVILAMGAGRRAAKAIAAWLQMGKVKWPVTTEDAEAFIPGAAVGSLVPPSPAVDAAAQEQVATTASS
jgi:glutamate synthase (NADPH) small chain